MTIQSPEPQLVFRHAPGLQKERLVHHVQLSQDTSKKQQPIVQQLQVHEQPREEVQLLLNKESQPCFGWDISKIQIENVPLYFPRDMLQWENFPFQDLPRVLERISMEMRKSSVQASLIHEPLSAKLQTCHENVELYLVFFRENTTNSDDDGTVSMSVQRHKGDHYAANKCIQRLVNAAKGLHEEDYHNDDENKDMETDTSVTADAVLAMERLIERAERESASATQNNQNEQDQRHPFLDQTPEQMTECAVRDVYGWLEQSRRLDSRRHALEYLLAMTDLKRTLSSQAIAGSLIVLQGKVSPSTTTAAAAAAATISSELNTQAQAIQSILLSVLLTRELPGDRAIFMEVNINRGSSSNNNGTDDLEMRPYFPEVDDEINANSVGLPDYYTEYMNELFHLALQILVQSLEVVACFSNSIRGGVLSVGESLTKQLLDTASDVADGKDLYHTLLGCIVNAESKLANGYLACKALRLLALDHPGIKEQMKLDINAKQCIGNAYQVGQVRHTLLKDESYQLWQTVCQQ
jgi:hypothetical protein